MFLNLLRKRTHGSTPRPLRRRIDRHCRFGVEGLEGRELLATLYVSTGGSDGNSGAIGSPLHSIQAAVTAANSGDEIRVAAGTYTYDPSADKFGPKKQFSYASAFGDTPVVAVQGKQLKIYGGFSPSDFSKYDPAANPTIIDGQGSHRGIFVLPQGSNPTSLDLQGFTIQNSLAKGIPSRGGGDAVFAFGGALFADMGGNKTDNSPWILKDLVFSKNTAAASGAIGSEGGRGAGGAIALRFVNNVTLFNVRFEGNQAVGADGSTAGGGGLGGAIHTDHSNIVGSNITFTNNTAKAGNSSGSGAGPNGESADALGGALAVQAGSRVSLSHVVATGNQAIAGNAAGRAGTAFGGALYAEATDASLTVGDAFIQGNTAKGGTGSSGGFTVGGGIASENAVVTVKRSRLVGNTAVDGAEIFLRSQGTPGPNSIVDTVIANNGANIGIVLESGTTNLDRVTLDNFPSNTSPSGSQALVAKSGSTVNLANSIVSNVNVSAPDGALATEGSGQLNLSKILAFNVPRLFTDSSVANGKISGRDTVNVVNPTTAIPNLYASPGPQNWNYSLNALTSAFTAGVGSTQTVSVDEVATPASPSASGTPSTPPPTAGFAATGAQIIRSARGITGAVIQFNAPLSAKVAKNLRAYRLAKISGKKPPRVSKATFNAGNNTVTVRFGGPIRPGSTAALNLNGGLLKDTSGRNLSGTTSFTLAG